MTRIASSHPAIWPDICVANRDAIVTALDEYLAALMRVRAIVAGGDRDAICSACCEYGTRAPVATCPPASPSTSTLVELRIPIPDRPGRARRGHHARRPRSASTSPTSRSRTRSRVAAVCSCSSSPSGADAFEHALVEHGYHVGADVAVE